MKTAETPTPQRHASRLTGDPGCAPAATPDPGAGGEDAERRDKDSATGTGEIRLSLTREVGERARAEQALRTSEERYRALFDSIDEGVAIIETVRDPSGAVVDALFVDVNTAFERHSGLYDVRAAQSPGGDSQRGEAAAFGAGAGESRAAALPTRSRWRSSATGCG